MCIGVQGDDRDALLAELDVILKQPTLSSEEVSVIIKDLYHESACRTVQTAFLHILAAMAEAGFQLRKAPSDGNEEQVLDLSMAKAVLLTLALPLDVQLSEDAAAQAIKQHVVGRQLSWCHFDCDMCGPAGGSYIP